MAEEERPDVVEGSVEDERGPVQVIYWDHNHHFESRSLTPKDLQGLGAEQSEDDPLQAVTWDQANGWTVPRDQVPLNDMSLGALLATDKSFRLKDA